MRLQLLALSLFDRLISVIWADEASSEEGARQLDLAGEVGSDGIDVQPRLGFDIAEQGAFADPDRRRRADDVGGLYQEVERHLSKLDAVRQHRRCAAGEGGHVALADVLYQDLLDGECPQHGVHLGDRLCAAAH